MKNKKETITLSPEEFKRLKEINKKQRARNKIIKKRIEELKFSDGIVADFSDIMSIYKLQFWLKLVNFFGEFFQNIQNIFNRKFVQEKNKLWYKNIFIKYDIPKEISMTYIKDEFGRFKFVIPEENENK
jgi:hypothetical protein